MIVIVNLSNFCTRLILFDWKNYFIHIF